MATASIVSTPLQEFKGWGFTPCPRDNTVVDKTSIADAIYALQPTFFRVAVDDCWDNYGNFRQAGLDKLKGHIQAASLRGCNQYVLSTWSPPLQFKKYKTNDGQVNGDDNNLLPEFEDDYVACYVRVLQQIQGQGLPLPTAISIQNEADYASEWPGCKYSPDQWIRVCKLMRTGFDNAGFSGVKIFGVEPGSTPSMENFLGIDFAKLGSDAALNSALDAYAIHTYTTSTKTQSIRDGIAAYPKEVWMSEWSHLNGSVSLLNQCLNSIRHMMMDFCSIRANYWIWWWAWLATDRGNGEHLMHGTEGGTLGYHKNYHVFKRLWNTVKPGWKIHRLNCDDPNLQDDSTGDTANLVDMLAWVKGDGSASVVMLVNPTTSSISMTVQGLKGTTVDVFRTSGTQDMAKIATASTSGSHTLTLPASTITLLSATGGTVTEPAPAGTTIRINAGRTTNYTDPSGNVWEADRNFADGSTSDRGSIAIDGTTNDVIYQTERYGLTGYSIPVPAPGVYQVKLHFAETFTSITAAGQRVFDVQCACAVLKNLDIFAESGGLNRALVKTFTVELTGTTLNLKFTPKAQNTLINGIEITPLG